VGGFDRGARDFTGVRLRIASKRTTLQPVREAARIWAAATGGTVDAENIPITVREAIYERWARDRDGTYDLIDAHDPLVPRLGDRLYRSLDEPDVEIDDFVPATLGQMRAGGTLYGLPAHGEVEIFIYNRIHFAEAGLDPDPALRTWDELIDHALRFRAAGRYGCVVPWLAPGGEGFLYWLCMLNSTGVRLLSDDRREVLLDERALAVWETLDRGFRSEFFDPISAAELPREWPYSSDHESGLVFNRGEAASQINVVELWFQAVAGSDDWQRRIPPDAVAASLLPGIEPGTSGSLACAEGLGINRFGRQQDAALDFLLTLTGRDYQRRMMLEERGFVLPSSRRSVLADPEIRAHLPLAELVARQSTYVTEHYPAPFNYQAVVEDAIARLFRREWTPREAHDRTIAGIRARIRDHEQRGA
jgi:ABC-type glycerol-3-phosphate transport system substrate-binding protein